MKNLAKLCPASAWISVSVSGWASAIVLVRCGLVEDSRRYMGFSVKDAEKQFRREFGLVGVRLRRLSC